jgi:flagellar basal-body rod protein FlgB
MDFMDKKFELIARSLDATSARHRVVATNIANVNTPNYRAKTLKFEGAFQEALAKGDHQKALKARVLVEERENAPVKADGNSVHLEHEFGELQKNRMAHDTYNAILRQRISMIRQAISGTR